jgi:hypothetical protein
MDESRSMKEAPRKKISEKVEIKYIFDEERGQKKSNTVMKKESWKRIFYREEEERGRKLKGKY